MNLSIVFVSISDDWECMYVDGKLAFENHTISAHDALSALGLKYATVQAPEDHEDTGPDHLPKSWAERAE